ncbi:MAG: hypothetical protein QM578_12565 [Pantoea sp.]
MLISAKIIGAGWMLCWFVMLLKITIKHVNAGLDPIAAMFSLAFAWLLVGFLPVAIVKFGWGFIS